MDEHLLMDNYNANLRSKRTLVRTFVLFIMVGASFYAGTQLYGLANTTKGVTMDSTTDELEDCPTEITTLDGTIPTLQWTRHACYLDQKCCVTYDEHNPGQEWANLYEQTVEGDCGESYPATGGGNGGDHPSGNSRISSVIKPCTCRDVNGCITPVVPHAEIEIPTYTCQGDMRSNLPRKYYEEIGLTTKSECGQKCTRDRTDKDCIAFEFRQNKGWSLVEGDGGGGSEEVFTNMGDFDVERCKMMCLTSRSDSDPEINGCTFGLQKCFREYGMTGRDDKHQYASSFMPNWNWGSGHGGSGGKNLGFTHHPLFANRGECEAACVYRAYKDDDGQEYTGCTFGQVPGTSTDASGPLAGECWLEKDMTLVKYTEEYVTSFLPGKGPNSQGLGHCTLYSSQGDLPSPTSIGYEYCVRD